MTWVQTIVFALDFGEEPTVQPEVEPDYIGILDTDALSVPLSVLDLWHDADGDFQHGFDKSRMERVPTMHLAPGCAKKAKQCPADVPLLLVNLREKRLPEVAAPLVTVGE